jgi:hypothetical protein
MRIDSAALHSVCAAGVEGWRMQLVGIHEALCLKKCIVTLVVRAACRGIFYDIVWPVLFQDYPLGLLQKPKEAGDRKRESCLFEPWQHALDCFPSHTLSHAYIDAATD